MAAPKKNQKKKPKKIQKKKQKVLAKSRANAPLKAKTKSKIKSKTKPKAKSAAKAKAKRPAASNVTIEHSVFFSVGPALVYQALTDAEQLSAITGSTVEMEPVVGGKFVAYDGYCQGDYLELVPGQKIVHTWRASDWPGGVDSRVTIRLQAERGGTRLLFDQTGIPADELDSIDQGWVEYYWEPMQTYFLSR